MAADVEWTGRIGQRIAVRCRLEGGGFTDVVGELTAVDDDLHVVSRQGPVRIPLRRVVAGKVVPPRPVRPGPPHLAVGITDLERVMAVHWQAAQTARVGDWLLRATGGFTNRANSALPLGDAGTDPGSALLAVRDWYAVRGLPGRISLAGPATGGVTDDDGGPADVARDAALAAGWRLVPDASALVLTARTASARGAGALPPGFTIAMADAPDDAWLATYRYRGQALPPAALLLLRSAPEQVFVAVRDAEGSVVAVARGSLGGGWAGLTGVEVIPPMRRRGLGTTLLGAVADWAWRSGTASLFLQVAESNVVAQQTYRRAGFVVHHRYEYHITPPPPP